MITQDDVLFYFHALTEIMILVFVISRIITFIPSFMVSLVRSIRNKSLIEHKDLLDTSLDKSEFGLKVLINRWFK